MTTPTPSVEVLKVLSAAVKRAVRLEFGRLGTENLLISLVDTTGPGRKLGVRSMRAQAMARGTEHWAGDDGGVAEPHPDVTALVRAACHHARVETVLPVSGALDECLRAALAEAGSGALTTTHLCLALLSLDRGRAADLFTVRRVDVDEVRAQVRAAAEPEEAPAVRMLRKSGALEGDSGGGYVRLLLRLVVRGQGLGGPVLPIVRGEADRLAVAAGREEATVADLVAAVLTVDHQLASSGRKLRPGLESGGAAALRAAGVDPAALTETPAAAHGGVDRAVEAAKLVAARRGDEVVGTKHLLLALRDDPFDPLSGALSGLAVET